MRSESCLESDNFALRSEVVAMVKQIPGKIRGKLTRTGESGKLQAWRLYLYQWWPTQILVNVAWSPHARGPQKTSWQTDAKTARKGNSHDVRDILKILFGEISIHVPVRSVPIDRIPTCTETLSHHLSGMQRTKKVPSSIRTFKSGIGMRKTWKEVPRTSIKLYTYPMQLDQSLIDQIVIGIFQLPLRISSSWITVWCFKFFIQNSHNKNQHLEPNGPTNPWSSREPPPNAARNFGCDFAPVPQTCRCFSIQTLRQKIPSSLSTIPRQWTQQAVCCEYEWTYASRLVRW